jgi:hypothetical protein
MLEKYTLASVEAIKSKSQEVATVKEILATINECTNVVEQIM